VRVRRRRKESSRLLSHLLVSVLSELAVVNFITPFAFIFILLLLLVSSS